MKFLNVFSFLEQLLFFFNFQCSLIIKQEMYMNILDRIAMNHYMQDWAQ